MELEKVEMNVEVRLKVTVKVKLTAKATVIVAVMKLGILSNFVGTA